MVAERSRSARVSTQLELRTGAKRNGDCAERERDAGELRIGGRALELCTGRTLDLCG